MLRVPLQLLRTLAAWTLAVLAWGLFLPVYLLTLRRLPDAWLSAFIHAWARLSLAVAGIQLSLENASTLEGVAARVFICNHQSGLDLVWGAALSPPRPLVIAKKEMVWVPVLNVIWWALRFIRIDRSSSTRALSALRHVAAEVAASQRTLFIGPEGTRTRDGRIGPFKKGAFHIALQGRVPIYPVVVHGAFECLPRGAFLIRPGRVRVVFLPPVDTCDWKAEELEARVAQVRAAMVEAYAKLGGPV